jgi:hypothetical protein
MSKPATPAQPIGRMMLKDARLAFPNLFEPTTVNGEGKPRYNASLIISTDHPQIAEIKAKMRAVADAKWGAKAAATYTSLEKADKLGLHDGDAKSYDGFAGNLFISAASQESTRPTVIDQNKAPLSARDGKPYAGCFVNASIEFWAQDNNFGKRINAQLRGVQFLRDGDAFAAGRPADSDEFEEVTEGADAAEFA